MPQKLVRECLPALACAYCEAQDYRTIKVVDCDEFVPFHRTTLYNGAGFYGRPEMFYTVGCFTFVVRYQGDKVIIFGEDDYDWHPTSEGDWFCSPLPLPEWLAKPIVFVLGMIFGEDCFPMKGFPSEKPSVSNKFWARCANWGAKPFKTIFRAHFSASEWADALRNYDEPKEKEEEYYG